MSEKFALIVEDDEDLSTIFTEALKAANFKAEAIMDGAEAQQRLGEVVPDVIVLDLHLPHVSGEELLDLIRADERMAKTQVIVATADASMAEILEEKADLVLLKPISFMQLRAMASRLGELVE